MFLWILLSILLFAGVYILLRRCPDDDPHGRTYKRVDGECVVKKCDPGYYISGGTCEPNNPLNDVSITSAFYKEEYNLEGLDVTSRFKECIRGFLGNRMVG